MVVGARKDEQESPGFVGSTLPALPSEMGVRLPRLPTSKFRPTIYTKKNSKQKQENRKNGP